MSDKTTFIEEILALLGKVSDRLEPESDAVKQWMSQHIDNPLVIELLRIVLRLRGDE